MKYSLVALLATLSFGATAGATIYEHGYFKGKSSYIGNGEMIDELNKRRIFANDSVSSLKVDHGTCVVLYKNAGYSSTAKYFSGGEYADLVDYRFNDETTSIQVFKSHRCDSAIMTHFYNHGDYNTRGGHFSLPPNSFIRDLDKGHDATYWHKEWHANDVVSSIKVGINSCVTLYRDHHFRGASKKVGKNAPTLRAYNFNDEASSIRVTSGSCK
ncbi:beta/gamma crystallin-related protein [Pseudoalteromonas sp. PPB1]|uniref:beta/gamma crystallin-related protein n=1 Tax=Pseudoalteromonas sp. PPB1 TaxID=2756136 RepID=UPI0018912C5A|nr:beta/gamma crystallin-related protein [Pseudoalteromonas sp. PPB1]